MKVWQEQGVGETFAAVARDWCDLIEGRAMLSGADLLIGAHPLLSMLYARACTLPEVDEDDPEPFLEVAMGNVESHMDRLRWANEQPVSEDREWFSMSYAEWQKLYTELQALFRDEHHWVVDEPYSRDAPEPGSSGFADEFVDIYRDVRHGLKLWSQDYAGREAALLFWRISFSQHWGGHALDALRAMHDLAFADQEDGEEESQDGSKVEV